MTKQKIQEAMERNAALQAKLEGFVLNTEIDAYMYSFPGFGLIFKVRVILNH